MQLTFAVFLIGLVGFVDSSTSTSSKSSSSKSSSSKSSKSSSSTSYEPRPYPDYPSSLEEAQYFFLCEDNFFQAVTTADHGGVGRRLKAGRFDLKGDSDLSLWEVAPTAYLGDIMSRKLHFDELSSDTTDPYSDVMYHLAEDKEAEMSRLSKIANPEKSESSLSERQEFDGFGTICQNHGGIAAGGCSARTPIECILHVCGDTGQGRCCVDKSKECEAIGAQGVRPPSAPIANVFLPCQQEIAADPGSEMTWKCLSFTRTY